MAPRRPGRPGQAVRRDAARREGDHRPAPHPRRDHRDHPGERTARAREPGQRGRHRRRRPRPARDRGVHRRQKEDGNRSSDYFLFVKGNQPSLQKAVFDATRKTAPATPITPNWTTATQNHPPVPVGTAAEGIDFPHVTRAARIRRDRYDLDGTLISKEIVHAVTSLGADRASAASLASIARGQCGIERCTGCATPRTPKTPSGYAGNGPQVMATRGISPQPPTSPASPRSPAPPGTERRTQESERGIQLQ